MSERRFADLTTEEAARVFADGSPVALVPVGSLEPHGPHLPLLTDTRLSEECALRACAALSARGIDAWVAPSVPYGVTDCAEGFAGAASTGARELTAFLRSVASGLLSGGFVHVCFVNSHLEPAHVAAVQSAADGLTPGSASVASPVKRRWARALSHEFKRGACHAGRYETSLMLAADAPVRAVYRDLPPIDTSLAHEIAAGRTRFRDMGLSRAYAGAPAEATREEGDALYARNVDMIVTEVTEGLARRAPPSGAAMDPTMTALVMRMMESHGYRELAAAQLFASGVPFAPDLASLKFITWHVCEETAHYEAVAQMYAAFTGASLEPLVKARLRARPLPRVENWFELAMAQFLFDRGGFWQLREYETSAFLPYRHVLGRILAEEAGHQAFGERIVVKLCQSGAYDAVKQPVFDRWLRQALLSFGRPGTANDRYAVRVGLKKREAGMVMRDFLDDIRSAANACGLRFPQAGDLGLDVPADFRGSLDGATE